MKKQIIQTQELIKNIYFNLNNLNETFTKIDSTTFYHNEFGNLYQLINYNPNHSIYTLKEM